MKLLLDENDIEALSARVAELVAAKLRGPGGPAAGAEEGRPLTLAEAAGRLGLSQMSVRRLVEAGELRRVPGLRHWRVLAGDVERLRMGGVR
jgi:excisionase family DNA binding protein